MKTYNTKTKKAANFKIFFTNAWSGEKCVNCYVTRRAAERNLEELKIVGHFDIELKEA